MPAADLMSRKKALVHELNGFIGLKKELSASLEARQELTASSSRSPSPERQKGGEQGLLPLLQRNLRGHADMCLHRTVLLHKHCACISSICRRPVTAARNACAELSVQQLMEKGRKEMKGQDDSLIRAQRIVESTIEVPASGPLPPGSYSGLRAACALVAARDAMPASLPATCCSLGSGGPSLAPDGWRMQPCSGARPFCRVL